MESVPPENESGAETVVDCTWPEAEVLRRPLETPEIHNALVDAFETERLVAVAFVMFAYTDASFVVVALRAARLVLDASVEKKLVEVAFASVVLPLNTLTPVHVLVSMKSVVVAAPPLPQEIAVTVPEELTERQLPVFGPSAEMVRFVVDAEPMPVMLLPPSVMFPVTLRPETEPTVRFVAERFVDDAVELKNAVAVALPSVTFCDSWYATDVVECARPFAAKLDAEVVEK